MDDVFRKLLQLMKPYFESQRKIENKMWLTKKAKLPFIANRCQSTTRVFYTIYFNSEGPVVQVPIPKGRSITGHVYKNVVLKKVKKKYERKRPKSNFATFDIFMTTP